MDRHRLSGACAVIAVVAASTASAQTVNVWPGVAPGSEKWTYQERTVTDTPIGPVVFDVATPTLTVYLPDASKATGTGVIVAPGGAFIALAVGIEGTDVARWLQDNGIAAFVLKYRIMERREGEALPNPDDAGKYGIADAIQALKVIRQHAAEYGIAANRVGLLGFSAGAMVASGALLNPDAAARPNFAALAYGAPFGAMPPIPKELPPVFLTWAQDDAITLRMQERFREALESAGHKPEVHVFNRGGHGFGMKKQGTSSDHWIDALYFWLQAQGLTQRVK
jgi:acetyl esterase/lipase